MNCTTKVVVLAASLFLLASVLVPAVKATDDATWPTQLTLLRNTQIGDMIFVPGLYELRSFAGPFNRSAVSIYSVDRGRWEGIALGVPAYRSDKNKMSGFVIEKRIAEEPDALQYWFYQDWTYGIQFVSPHIHAHYQADLGAVSTAAAVSATTVASK